MATNLTSPRLLHEKFKFLVRVEGITSAAFQKMSELSVEAAKVEYYEGASLIPIKDPGRLTYSDVTLERGASQSENFFTWMKEVSDARLTVDGGGQGSGMPSPLYKREIGIEQLERDNTILRTWQLANAWPTKYVAGDWDNTVDEVVIETLTLTYDYFDID